MTEYEWGVRYEVKMPVGDCYVIHVKAETREDAISRLGAQKNSNPRAYCNVQLIRRPIGSWEVVDDD